MPRPHCAVFIATSLDGFIARRDGSIDWLDAVRVDGEDYGFAEFFGSVDTLVVGRATWETVRGFAEWPYAGKRVVVLTHRTAAGEHGERFLAGEPATLLERLQGEGAHRVYVDGGTVVSQFIRAGMIDDLTVSIIPVLLGDGIRLFQAQERQPERPLQLAGSRAFASGLVQLRYRTDAH